MASENAKAVAKEVIENVRKGTKIKLGKIIKKHGYSDSVAQHPKKVTETQSFKESILPLKDELDSLRSRTIEALSKRDLNKAKIGELSSLLKGLNHDIKEIFDTDQKEPITIVLTKYGS